MHVYKFLQTTAGVTVIVNGRAYNVSSDHPHYEGIISDMRTGVPPETLLARIEATARMVLDIVRNQLTENLEYCEGVILYKGEVLHNAAATRMVDLIKRHQSVTAISNFVEKLQLNPNQEMVEHLYTFLEFGHIPLTPDGDFLVYKAVRPDFKDIHSGRFLNAVGCVNEVPRQAVDPNRASTCSYGLHVCSYAYLPSFAQANGHVMLCKVSPTDVVAIPHDYNNTKMRVCRYEVVGEVTSYYKQGQDELGTGPGVRSAEYQVWYREPGYGQDDDYQDEDFYTMDEAKAVADALKQENPEWEVWVEKGESEDKLYVA